jgi:hypothetical protein
MYYHFLLKLSILRIFLMFCFYTFLFLKPKIICRLRKIVIFNMHIYILIMYSDELVSL